MDGTEGAAQDAFINEDDLSTFAGWLKFQGFDAAAATPDELAMWRRHFEEAQQRGLSSPVGLMKLKPLKPGEYRYAVAVRDGSHLRLTLWVRCSSKGFFVMVPRGDGHHDRSASAKPWDPHTSYHLDGRLHMKSFNAKNNSQQRQPLMGNFRGTENLGAHLGHGPKRVGAICDPTAFSGIVEVGPGVLGPRHGSVIVDLVEPGCEPVFWENVVQQEVFCDGVPWVVIRIAKAHA
jgi:hypothetical protein